MKKSWFTSKSNRIFLEGQLQSMLDWWSHADREWLLRYLRYYLDRLEAK